MLRTLPALAIGTWLVFQSSFVRADPAAAEALFREGRELLERGEVVAACEKLAASSALEPSAGTLLNLATCRLKQGKIATAWAHFVSAERLAQNQNRPEQAREAERRALELEPKLATLTLLVPSPPPGLEVRRAGQVVQAGSFGTRVPVDPGQIVIEASAPGYEPFRTELAIGAIADRRVVEIRMLAHSPIAAPVGAAGMPAGDALSQKRARGAGSWPWVIGGVGGAALLTGGVFGLLALNSNATAKSQCDDGTRSCSGAALQIAERRDREALVSTLGVGVGLVGIGVAAFWWLSSSSGGTKSAESAWSYDAELTRGSASVRMRAAF